MQSAACVNISSAQMPARTLKGQTLFVEISILLPFSLQARDDFFLKWEEKECDILDISKGEKMSSISGEVFKIFTMFGMWYG